MQQESTSTDCIKVYHYITQNVFSGAFQPGYKLIEKNIAAACEVSRTPVRLAIERVVSEGIAFRAPNCSAKVRQLSVEDITGLLSIRAVNEGLAARLAAQRATPEQVQQLQALGCQMQRANADGEIAAYRKLAGDVHNEIIAIAGNDYLRDLIAKIYSITHRYHMSVMSQPGRMDRSCEEHMRVIQYVAAGNGEEAEKAMNAHIMSIVHFFQDESNLAALRAISTLNWD